MKFWRNNRSVVGRAILPAAAFQSALLHQAVRRLSRNCSFANRAATIGSGLLYLLFLSACGYHLAGKADLVPKSVQTIAVPPFANITVRYKLTDRLPDAIAREFIDRTRYQIVNDPRQADAVLTGAVINYITFPTVFDQATNRASGLQVNVTMRVTLTERATGKVLFSRPSFELRQRYEISTSSDTKQYFEESGTALARLSRDVARDVVSAILENF